MSEPIGHIEYTSTIKVPVYRPDELPEGRQYDVGQALTDVMALLSDRKRSRKLSAEQLYGMVHQLCYLVKFDSHGVKLYPAVSDDASDSTQNV